MRGLNELFNFNLEILFSRWYFLIETNSLEVYLCAIQRVNEIHLKWKFCFPMAAFLLGLFIQIKRIYGTSLANDFMRAIFPVKYDYSTKISTGNSSA